jgi:hypothetical protein
MAIDGNRFKSSQQSAAELQRGPADESVESD